MTEVIIPSWIIPEEESHEWLDEGSSVFRSAFAPGNAQRQSYGGLRLKLSRRHTVRLEEKSVLLAALKATKGSYNTLRSRVHFALRGSISTTQLFSNSAFSNGTTGWSSDTDFTLSVSDRLLRSTRNRSYTAGAAAYQTISVTANAAYAARSAIASFRGPVTGGVFWNGVGEVTGAVGNLRTMVHVPSTSTFITGTTLAQGSVDMAGDYVDIPYMSAAKCLLVDNGTNMLLQSDAFDNASWTKTRSSVSAGATGPDGTSSADTLIEDATASNNHFASQSVTVAAAAGDYCFTIALRQNTRTWAAIQLVEATGSTSVEQHINLATGALGTGSNGANWSNRRAFVTSLGDFWYQITIVARKTNAATSLSARVYLSTGDAVFTYSGDGASSIRVWRATLAQSSVPVRLIATTTTASTGTAQTGTALYVKGLDASASGLLLPSDWIEINGELKQVSSALNSNSSGLGHLQFEPQLIRSPSDNDPVIVVEPMGKFLVSNIKIDNEFGTQAQVSYDLEHIYE